MKYLFNDFLFDSEQLTLYKQNEVVSCRHNEARLLALFLSDPKRIFSKDDILKQVWNDKIVSEQAVFQNISVLRAILGDDAIKTFPKKGYQWQLDIKPYVDAAITSEVIAPEKVRAGFGKRFWFLAIAVVLVMGVVGVFLGRSLDYLPQTRIAILPLLIEPANQHDKLIDTKLVQPAWELLNQADNYSPITVNNLKDYQDFFHTPQKYLGLVLQQSSSDAVLVAMVGMRDDEISIRYLLTSKKGSWSASHSAKTIPLLLNKLNEHLTLILNSGVLTVDKSDSNLLNARLKILHQQAPDDLVILAELANSEIRTGNGSNAILLVDELIAKAKSQHDITSEGNAYIIAANGYLSQSLFAEANTALHNASELFTARQDYRNLSLVHQTYGYVAFEQQNYEKFKQSLISAMQFAQQAQDPLLEVSMSTYLSVVGNKFGNKDDRQIYLDRAEAVLDQTNQSREHYGLIYFYAGMYAENDAIAEKHYRKVLAILPVDQQWWERDRAREHLTRLLINQSRWNEALELYSKSDKLDATEELMVSTIHAAQQDLPQAEIHALAAFKMANLSGQKYYALDAALALLTIYKSANQSEKMPLYKQFIAKEAGNFSFWIKVNKDALDKFAIVVKH